MRVLARDDVLGRAGRNDAAAAVAALGSEVDDPVGGLDDVEVVLDDQDGVAALDKPLQHDEQLPNVVEVQARGWLVEDVEGAPVLRRCSSLASFTRWASPPDSVVAGWPSLM